MVWGRTVEGRSLSERGGRRRCGAVVLLRSSQRARDGGNIVVEWSGSTSIWARHGWCWGRVGGVALRYADIHGFG